MAIKEIFESNTDKIDIATQLLSELSDREGRYVWKKLTAQNGTFVDYVTADSADAYPNGGTQDGFWYELVKEGIPYTGANPLTIGEAGATIPANTLLETALQIVNGVKPGVDLTAMFGCTKYAINEVVFSSRTAWDGGTIAHSLSAKPVAFIIIGESVGKTNGDIHAGLCVDREGASLPQMVSLTWYYNMLVVSNSSGIATAVNLTESNIVMKVASSTKGYLTAGIKYYIITMA